MYRTEEIEIASFLKARNHRLVEVKPHGHLVEFGFPDEAANDVPSYLAAEAVSARELFEANRNLRLIIKQTQQHQQAQNRTENNNADPRNPQR